MEDTLYYLDLGNSSEDLYYDYAYYIPLDENDTSTTTTTKNSAKELHATVVSAFLLSICAVGLLGNGLVIHVIVRHVAMRKVTYLYLLNLAVVNIIFLLTNVPLKTVYYLLSDWLFGSVACKMDGYVSGVCLAVSVLTLTATGIDRYLAVMHPVRSRTLRTEKKAGLVILSIWLVSIVLMIPRIFLFEVEVMLNVAGLSNYCTRLQTTVTLRRLDTMLMFAGTYLFPQLVLVFCHLKIGLRLWKSQRPGAESQEVSLLALRERRRIAKIVFAITVAFGVGWLPLHVTRLVEDFLVEDEVFFSSRELLVLSFSFSANAVNPILYCLLSKHFRRRFKLALACMGTNTTRINQGNAQHALTPVVAFQNQEELQRAVIIDLDDDMPDDNQQGEVPNAALSNLPKTEISEKAAMIPTGRRPGGDAKPSPSIRTPTQKRLAYLKVVPSTGSCPDSGHESEDEDRATTSGLNGPPCGGVWVGINTEDQQLPRVV